MAVAGVPMTGSVWVHASEHRDLCSRGGTKNVSCLCCSFLDEPFLCLSWEVWNICLIGALLIYGQWPGERKTVNYFPSHFVSLTVFLNQSLLDWGIQLFICTCVRYPYNISTGFLNCFHQCGFTCVSINFSLDEILSERRTSAWGSSLAISCQSIRFVFCFWTQLVLSTVLSVPSLLGSCCLAGLFGWFFCSRMKFGWIADVVNFSMWNFYCFC